MRQIDRFAELLAEHDAFAKPPKKGGQAAACALKMGLSPLTGNSMLQRIRRQLGWQAK